MAGELGNTLWNDLELATYSDTANKKAYQEALNQAKSNFEKHNKEIYEGASPFEQASLWFVNGLLAGEGDEDRYLKKHGFTQDIKDAGEAGLLDRATLSDYTNQVERDLTSDMEKGVGAVRGGLLEDIPIVGGVANYLLEPIAQTAGAGQALNAGLGSGDWDRWNKRDKMSDVGALGQTLLNVATPLVAPSGIAAGAVTGGLDNMFNTMREEGAQTNLGNLLSSAGTGAAFGALIPAAGKVAGKIGQRGEKYLANQALSSGLTNDAGVASQIAKNTGKFTKARAAFSSLPKIGKAGVVGSTVAGGLALNNLLNGGSNSAQTGYNDNATYGSDLYGTTQGYNYGTYGY